MKKNRPIAEAIGLYGAGNEARTRYLHLGKVALYRMSYARVSRLDYTTICRLVKDLFLPLLRREAHPPRPLR